ncbi:MAG: CHASE2 domain-containing protein [Desulfobacteraceae bacterium]|nr:MAG: CHASE2 domain-containing protein [Desulfobacteraceae bacterium]
MLKRLRSFPFLITLIILGVAMYAAMYAGSDQPVMPFLDIIELKTIDLRFKLRGEKKPGSSVVIAVVDEKSLKQEGKWIWPRQKIADLITKLSDAGARVVAFDIVFSEPDNKGVGVLHDVRREMQYLNIENAELNQYLIELTQLADNDRILAEAIKNSKARVVLGSFFHINPQEAAHMDENAIAAQLPYISTAVYQSVQYASEKAFLNIPVLEVAAQESNIPVISESTSYSGFFNMMPDKEDGVVRWIPGIYKFRDNLYAHLSIKALSAYTGSPLNVFVGEYGIDGIQIGDLQVPTDEKGRIMVNYRGTSKTFPHLSATDILQGRVPAERIKDKLVLVGVTAIGIYDLRVTPFDTNFPGVEIKANLIDSILSQDYLYQPDLMKIYNILAILILGGLLGWFLPRANVIIGLIMALSLLAGYIIFCLYLFTGQGVVINAVYPLITILLIYISITAYRYFVEERQKRFIKSAFSTYLAPAIVNQLIASPEKLVLGGEERQITAFFSDIAGFTTISEKLSPHELVELLNEFLTEMSDIILKHNGMVDKYEGDAIIAMFGAPNALPNHAEAACLASIDMQARLAVLREKWQNEKNITIRMRIGLCSGPAVVGNMGSKNRMDYTMMGDTVNTAARLEGVNKVYGTYIMMGETTSNDVKNSVVARELDAINVVGKKIPVKIYELVGYQGQVSSKMLQAIDTYEKGLAAYRGCEWDQAIDFFNQALSLTPDDPPSQIMIDRCLEYKLNPPEACWNGAYIMRTK